MPSTRRARTALPSSPYVEPPDSDEEDSEDTIIARPRRTAFTNSQATTAAMQRNAESPDPTRKAVRLTMKNPHGASRLREVTSASDTRRASARSSRKRAPIVEDDSDEDEEEDDDEDDDADGEVDEEGDEEDDAAGSVDADEDEDEDVGVVSPAPKIKIRVPHDSSKSTSGNRKPSPSRALGTTKSVEDKEMAEGDSSDDLSDLDEDVDMNDTSRLGRSIEQDDELDEEQDDDEDDAEGELDDEDEEMDEDGMPMDADTIRISSIADSDLDSDASGTPDPAKLTKRQRGTDDSSLLMLPNEAQKKKFFTAEQITMRRAEMARRRKDLSEKRNEEEKADTLKRLLEKRQPTRRSKAEVAAAREAEEFGGTPIAEGEIVRPSRAFARYVTSALGNVVGIPEEWNGAPCGRMFENAARREKQWTVTRRAGLVEEVE